MDSLQKTPKPTPYRATFRRHRLLLSLPLVLGILGAAVIVATHKTDYTSTANLWVDTAPPNASSVGPGAGALPTTPAAAEQSLLGELITTNQFAVAVADGSLLRHELGDQAEINLKAASYVTPAQVGSLVGGPQVLALSYTSSSPGIARSVLQAIINELIRQSTGLSAIHVQAAITYYKSLITEQSGVLASATANVNAFLATHPNATAQSNPNLSALVSAENAADQQLSQTKSSLSQAQGASGTTSGWMVDVIDTPSVAEADTFGKKKMVEVVLGGLFAGGLISFLGVLMLLPKREKERWEDELLDSGLTDQQWLADPLRPGPGFASVGEQPRDRDEPGRGQTEPLRERHGARTISWRR
jgi:hypothetical protein